MTRVVVPAEAAGSEPVRFEDRSIEKRIEAFEAATFAAVNAAASPGPQSAAHSPPTSVRAAGNPAGRDHGGREMIAVPSGWIPLVVAAMAVAIAAAAAAGFWAGWIASQPASSRAGIFQGQDGSGRR